MRDPRLFVVSPRFAPGASTNLTLSGTGHPYSTLNRMWQRRGIGRLVLAEDENG